MDFSDRPRSVRDYLNDTSVKALRCANEARTGMRGDAGAAGGARVCSAVLADVRDAFDLLAPWLLDRPQVTHAFQIAVMAAKGSGFRMEVPPEELAQMIAVSVEHGLKAARQAREEAGQEDGTDAPATGGEGEDPVQ